MKRLFKSAISTLLLLFVLTASVFADENVTLNTYEVEYDELAENTEIESADIPYIFNNNDNTITTLYYRDKIYLKQFDNNYNCILSKTISKELEMFGGYFNLKGYHYFVFASNNFSQSDRQEVYRIVKYNSNFDKIGTTKIFGEACEVTEPLLAGSVEITANGNTLYITDVYTDFSYWNDFFNNRITISLDSQSMTVNDIFTGEKMYQNYSENMNELVETRTLIDDNKLYYVEKTKKQLRIAERSTEIPSKIIDDQFLRKETVKTKYYSIYEFDQSDSEFYKNINIHSLVLSKSDFITSGTYNNNLYVMTVPKEQIQGNLVRYRQITNYNDVENINIDKSYLMQLAEDKFILLWQETDENDLKTIKYIQLNKSGEIKSDIIKIDSTDISIDCQPIIKNNKIIWCQSINSDKINLHELKNIK